MNLVVFSFEANLRMFKGDDPYIEESPGLERRERFEKDPPAFASFDHNVRLREALASSIPRLSSSSN
jgi:hypothetical protein